MTTQQATQLPTPTSTTSSSSQKVAPANHRYGTAEACYTTRQLRVWQDPYKKRRTEHSLEDDTDVLITHRVSIGGRLMVKAIYPHQGWLSGRFVEHHDNETMESILKRARRRKRRNKPKVDPRSGVWRGVEMRKGFPYAGQKLASINGVRVAGNSFKTVLQMLTSYAPGEKLEVEYLRPERPNSRRMEGCAGNTRRYGKKQGARRSAITSTYTRNQLLGAIKPGTWDGSEHIDEVSKRDYDYMVGAFKNIMMSCSPNFDTLAAGMQKRGAFDAADYNLLQQCRRLAARRGTDTGRTEVVFSFDCTGSMYPFFEVVTKNVADCCKEIFRQVPNVRVALIAHGDYSTCSINKTPYLMEVLPFTDSPKRVREFMQRVTQHGSQANCDGAECYELALRRMRELRWTPGSYRMGVLIGDSNPHEPDYTYYRCQNDPKTGAASNLTEEQCFEPGRELPEWQFASWDTDDMVDTFYKAAGKEVPPYKWVGPEKNPRREYEGGEEALECGLRAVTPGIDYNAELDELRRMQVHVHTIKCGESQSSAPFYELVAGRTSGMNLRLGDDRSESREWKKLVKEAKAQSGTSAALMDHTVGGADTSGAVSKVTARRRARAGSETASTTASSDAEGGPGSPEAEAPAEEGAKAPSVHGISSKFLPRNVVDLIMEYRNCIRV